MIRVSLTKSEIFFITLQLPLQSMIVPSYPVTESDIGLYAYRWPCRYSSLRRQSSDNACPIDNGYSGQTGSTKGRTPPTIGSIVFIRVNKQLLQTTKSCENVYYDFNRYNTACWIWAVHSDSFESNPWQKGLLQRGLGMILVLTLMLATRNRDMLHPVSIHRANSDLWWI